MLSSLNLEIPVQYHYIYMGQIHDLKSPSTIKLECPNSAQIAAEKLQEVCEDDDYFVRFVRLQPASSFENRLFSLTQSVTNGLDLPK